jgi:hypothetical protein
MYVAKGQVLFDKWQHAGILCIERLGDNDLVDIADGEANEEVHDDDGDKEQEEEEDQLGYSRVA